MCATRWQQQQQQQQHIKRLSSLLIESALSAEDTMGIPDRLVQQEALCAGQPPLQQVSLLGPCTDCYKVSAPGIMSWDNLGYMQQSATVKGVYTFDKQLARRGAMCCLLLGT